MSASPNRAYLLTPAGAAAIAVVRVCGPAVTAFLAANFTGTPRLGRASHGDLIARDGSGDRRVLDDPVVVLVRPDVADLNLHGGPWVVRATLDLLARAGFHVSARLPLPLPADAIDTIGGDSNDVVAPGPDDGSADAEAASARAKGLPADGPAGRPDLSVVIQAIERDVLAHLPLARTEPAVRALLSQPAAWAAFADRDPGPAEAAAVLADQTMRRLLFPAFVAIVGAANVGKSTLANQLFGRERSITADLPGTTRDWVGELADVDGVPVTLVDTPGLRATNDPIERAAIAAARGPVAAADLVVVVLDATRPADAEHWRPVTEWPQALVVVNKVDWPPAWDARAAPELGGRDVVTVIATTGQGVPPLRQAILRGLGCGDPTDGRPRWWTDRQRLTLERVTGRRSQP